MRKWIVLWMVFCGTLAGCQNTDRYQECYVLPEHKQTVLPADSEVAITCPSLDLFGMFPSLSSGAPVPMAAEMDFTQEDSAPSFVAKSAAPTSKKTSSENSPMKQEFPAMDCIDINLADEKQLTRLPGVGPSRARTIIAARDKRPFKRKKDLTRIKGIGPKSLKKLSDYICDI